MTARVPLDPRWAWLRSALSRLYAELDASAEPICLTVVTEDGTEMVSYSIAPGTEIGRRVITDIDGMSAAAEAATVDATPADILDCL